MSTGSNEVNQEPDFQCTKCAVPVTVFSDEPNIRIPPGTNSVLSPRVDVGAESPSRTRVTLPSGVRLQVMCEPCMDAILEQLKADIANANGDLSKYTEALFEIEKARRTGRAIEDEVDQNLSLLQSQEKSLRDELADLQEQENDLVRRLTLLQEEEARVSEEESKLGDEIVQLNRAVIDSEESIDSANRKLVYCSNSLKKLKKFNLISEAFFIHVPLVSSQPGSINGLRLGRTAEFPIPWSEINAAWGFMCLLADVLVKKHNVVLSHYRLLPRGSCSVIIKKSDRSALELFCEESSSSTAGITRFLTSRKFDGAVHAFVQVVGELASTLQRSVEKFHIPFKIDEKESTIGGVPATLQFNSEDNWTQALKHLLADLKVIVDL